MKISQLSTFIENRSGRLRAACEALAARGINIHTLCLADSRDFGILRLIVADPPYNIGKQFGATADRWPDEASYLAWCAGWLELAVSRPRVVFRKEEGTGQTLEPIEAEVTQEAATRASAQIKKREAELVDEFKKKGLGVHQVNRQSFVDAVLKNKPVESLGYERKDYDRIVGIK